MTVAEYEAPPPPPVGIVRMSWLRSAPPSLAGSLHGFTGVGVPARVPPAWP